MYLQAYSEILSFKIKPSKWNSEYLRLTAKLGDDYKINKALIISRREVNAIFESV